MSPFSDKFAKLSVCALRLPRFAWLILPLMMRTGSDVERI